jgi:uncharacterized protein YacL (UPF0231 family)
MKLLRSFILLFSLSLTLGASTQGFQVSGIILDQGTQEPMPYASILALGSGKGVVSDADGRFIFKDLSADSLKFSFLGYDSQTFFVDKATKDLRVELAISIFLGPEVIIRPLSPEDYLKVVIRRFSVNYSQEDHSILSFYNQEILEDGRILDHVEAGFYSVINSVDLKKNRHQLALFHEAEEEELQFMRKTAEKQKAKYLKKNPNEAEDFEDGELIKSTMPGPNALLGAHVGNEKLPILDSTKFKEFDYAYGPDSRYMGHEVITINYNSRGKSEGVRNEGTLFIDKNSDAIVSIQEQGIVVIPLAARPILFALGIKVENPPYRLTMKYRPMNGRWFIEQMHWEANVKIKKRHLFSENEDARFFLSQSLLIREIQETGYTAIPEAKLFDNEKKMTDQVHPISGITWDRVK